MKFALFQIVNWYLTILIRLDCPNFTLYELNHRSQRRGSSVQEPKACFWQIVAISVSSVIFLGMIIWVWRDMVCHSRALIKVYNSFPQHLDVFIAEKVAVFFGCFVSSAFPTEQMIISVSTLNKQIGTGFYQSVFSVTTVCSISHFPSFLFSSSLIYPILWFLFQPLATSSSTSTSSLFCRFC